jgi:predicted DsbA family dithiol-disulfide isomerase
VVTVTADPPADRSGPPNDAGRPTITVDIYSDVVYPWCYIGKRKFERGLAQIAGDLDVDVEGTYRPHQLDPTAAFGLATPVFDAYSKKFGGPERAEQIIGHVTSTAAETGIEFHMERALRANTLLAHRLIWLAAQPDSPVVQAEMKERLLAAYFTDGLDIGDVEILADCAAEVGFERDAIVEFLESDRGSAEVAAELREGYENGITAVPTYVFNGAWAVPGAQEPETFAQVLGRMADRALADTPSA